ncbi:MAG: hypothetical protein LBC92_01230, partial [Rickettsiales bacterium]|nr:hypothetical protein [Rickettsiales bacterium]
MSKCANKVLRKSFVFSDDEYLIPDLLSIQKRSYDEFLGLNIENGGISNVLKKYFPLYNKDKSICIDFVSYRFGDVIYSEKDCVYLGRTYSASLYVSLRLIVFDGITDTKKIRSIKEQEVYFCDIPLMTERASFVYSGIERVIISQLRKAPGLFFEVNEDTSSTASKISDDQMYDISARVSPESGSWISFLAYSRNTSIDFVLDKCVKIPIM